MGKVVSVSHLGGTIIRNNERYVLEDNSMLKNLVLSKTALKAGQETMGHSHSGVEEVYFFVKGKGRIQINNDFYAVQEGAIAVIEDGDFHKVINDSDTDSLLFVSVFQTYKR